MLPYHSYISWKLGPFVIQSFGLMMATAFLSATALFVNSFKKSQEKEHAYNIALLSIIFGILGSRLFYFIENMNSITDLLAFFNVWEGGLSWFGGFLGALLAICIYIKINRLDFLTIVDKLVPPLVLGHALGRVGCMLGDGGHVGKITSMPWGFNINGEVRHVTAFYEIIVLTLLFFTLLKIRKHKPYKGFIFYFYLLYYSIARFIIDFFRIEKTYLGLTLPQYICIILFCAGSLLMYTNINKIKHQQRKKLQPL